MRRPSRPRAAAAVAAALLLSPGLAACGDDGGDRSGAGSTTAPPATAAATAAPPPADPLGGYTPAPIEWGPCGDDLPDGLECATLAVPLAWDDPAGEAIELALARRPATGGDPAGVVLTNPGGPGAPGVDFLAGDPFAGTDLAARFDVVAWDPRGVGRSAGVDCGRDPTERFHAADPDPDDAAEREALEAAGAGLATACARAAGEMLAHVGTDDTARDLEAIRRALGRPAAYLGLSYGTLIGLRHAALFPAAGMRLALDGAVEPAATLTDLLEDQAVAFERVAAEVLAGVEELWEEVAAAAEADRVPAGDGRRLRPGDLLLALTWAAYDEAWWPELRDGLAEAADGDGSSLLALADLYRAGVDLGAYLAVWCLDSPRPAGLDDWARFAARLDALAPRLGAAIANELLPCATWPVPPDPVTGPVDAEGAGPVLVVGATGDPATPLAHAERVAAGLADGHLLVHDGRTHVAFFASGCVRDHVTAFLLDGTLPAPGTRC